MSNDGWMLAAIILTIVSITCGTSALGHWLDYRVAIKKAETEASKAQAESNARIQASIEETRRWEHVEAVREMYDSKEGR